MMNRGAKVGSALISTLLAIVVLTIIVTAFLQSMSIERRTATSYANLMKAQLAAQAGQAVAQEMLAEFIAANKYFTFGYEEISGDSLSETPVVPRLFGAPTPTEPMTTQYMLSTTEQVLAGGVNSAQVRQAIVGLDLTNSTALNSNADTDGGWMGSPLTSAGAIDPRSARAGWIYLLKNPDQPHQPDRDSPGYNPHVARFAYWVEDESSKIDLPLVGNADGPGGAFERPEFSVAPPHLDVGALPLSGGRPLAQADGAKNQEIVTFLRSIDGLPPDTRLANRLPNLAANVADQTRFYTSSYSSASELDSSGRQRLNLNALVSDASDAETIQAEIDDLYFGITGEHTYDAAVGGFFEGAEELQDWSLADFGSRFYPVLSVTDPHREIYVRKLAANIRDYIDADFQPTIIFADESVQQPVRPDFAWPQTTFPQAIGKEAVPLFQEHAWAGVELEWTPNGSTAQGTVRIDHYFEFLNPYTKDFTAPPGTFLKVYNQPTWLAGTFPELEPEDFTVDLSGVVFPAGGVVVVTTNPGPDATGLILNSDRLIRREPTPADATLFEDRSTDEPIGTDIGFQMDARSSSVTDYVTEMVMGTDKGILEGFGHVSISLSSSAQFNFKGDNVNDRRRFVYSSSLRGNDAASRTGDPRSLSEQLAPAPYNASNFDASRFYGAIQGTGNIPGAATLAKASVTYVSPTSWPDYAIPFDDTATSAYAVVRDGPMESIGELGHIYDPRRQRVGSSNILHARGGGRTLNIGQPDDVVGSAARFTPAWLNSAWRLADTFGVDLDRNEPLLAPTSRAKININSVTRDNGVALSALLRSFTFLPQPDGDRIRGGRLLSDPDIASLVSSIKTYIATNGPILERGELSQVSFFQDGTSAGGSLNRTTNDRGREEVFNRLVEMITTRPLSFSIYSVGEAISESASGQIRPLSRTRIGRVYEFEPEIPAGLREPVDSYSISPVYEIP